MPGTRRYKKFRNVDPARSDPRIARTGFVGSALRARPAVGFFYLRGSRSPARPVDAEYRICVIFRQRGVHVHVFCYVARRKGVGSAFNEIGVMGMRRSGARCNVDRRGLWHRAMWLGQRSHAVKLGYWRRLRVSGALLIATLGVFSLSASSASAATYTATEGTPVTVVLTLGAQLPGDISWGDGQTSPPTFTQSCGYVCLWVVSGTHTYAEAGSYTVTWRGASWAQVVVADATLTPGTGTGISQPEGPFAGRVATFTDANPDAAAKDFTATINWGDGQQSSGIVSAAAGGGFQVAGSHVYDEGSYHINVTINDVGGATTTVTGSSANMTDSALNGGMVGFTATEGSFSATVATFTDSNPTAAATDFRATIDWGDGTSTGTVTQLAAGQFQVSANRSFDEGTHPLKVAITDDGGATASLEGTYTILDAPLTPASTALDAFQGVPFSGTIGTFSDANPEAAATDFTATIDWGDGGTSAGTVNPAPSGGFKVTGTHTFTDAATRAVTVQIADDGSSSTTIHSTAQVGVPPVPVTTVALAPAAPDGQNGWYKTLVHATVSAVGLGVPVSATRCVFDPSGSVPGFDALPAACPFTGAGMTINGDGKHIIYAASVNAAGEKEGLVVKAIDVDTTPPTVTCATAPTFLLGATGAVVTATVADATSGPASATVSAGANTSSSGTRSIPLTGMDNAGNSTTVSCPYIVAAPKITAGLTWTINHPATFSYFQALALTHVPPGADVSIRCRGGGCPFARHTVHVATSVLVCARRHKDCKREQVRGLVSVNLEPLFAGRHLAVGDVVTFAVTKTNSIGEAWSLRMRSNQAPNQAGPT
jgi:hypothetical protein